MMFSKFSTISKDQSVKSAAEHITLNGFRGVIVTDEHRVVGVLTEGDILRFLIKQGALSAPIHSILTKNYIYLEEGYGEIEFLNLVKKGFTIIPVVDNEKKLLNILGLQHL